MVAVPAILPVAIPDVASIVILVLLLLHVPPVMLLTSVTLAPIHTSVGPEIVAGAWSIVTTYVL